GLVAAPLRGESPGPCDWALHSPPARPVAAEAPLPRVCPNLPHFRQDDSQALVKRLLEQRGHSPKANPPRAIHAIISGAKNRMLLPEELGASAESPLERVAAEIYAALGPALQQAHAMDFDDLLVFPLTLFAEH